MPRLALAVQRRLPAIARASRRASRLMA